MKRRISSLLISVMIVLGVSLAINTPDASAQASAEYSCGTYGANAYSNGNDCSGNNNTGGSTGGVGAPNTGFALLSKPDVYIPLGLSILAVIAGVLLLLKKRRKNIELGS